MASKLKLNEVVLQSPNGLVEKSISMGDDGVVKVNGVQVADIVSGTWTPELVGATTNPTVTYGVRYGSYVKIGKLVICHVMIEATITVVGGGALLFTIPFIARNSSLTYAHTRVGWVNSGNAIIPTGVSPINDDNKSALYSGTYADVSVPADGIGTIHFATMFSYFTD